VIALAHSRDPYEFAARAADIVLITPASADHAAELVTQVRAAEISTKRPGSPLSAYADLTVFLGTDEAAAAQRKERLDAADGSQYRSDSAIFTGTPEQLADMLLDWHGAGLDGFRLRPGVLPHDLEQVTRGLVPALQARGAFRRQYPAGNLRRRLGLEPHPANRYAREGLA
jgi:alkanesulfonate monooxygenase SsuD/methylene tetrahydromethanopterin reductase-like flavin-dependent oxidoreductase (luciferase family)